MEVFGIGPLELLLIFLLAIDPAGSQGHGDWCKKTCQLDPWREGIDLGKTTKEISDMPKKIMKETGLENELNQMRDSVPVPYMQLSMKYPKRNPLQKR